MAETSNLGLDGAWETDKKRSDSMQPFLEAVGVPWLVRKAFGNMSETVTFEQEGDSVRMQRASKFRTTTTEMRTDGKPFTFVAGDGSEQQMTALIDGKELVTNSRADDKDLDIEFRYSLQADGSMLARIRLLKSGKKEAIINRYYNKAKK